MTSSSAARAGEHRPAASIAWFAFMTASWAVFAVLLAGDDLGPILDAVRDAPLVLEIVWWVLGLPWLLAATVWEGSRSEGLRIAAVLAIVAGWMWLSWPRKVAAAPS